MALYHDPTRCKVALLAGGSSGEREISLASGEGARKALEEAGYTVVQLDPAQRADIRRLMDEEFDVAFLALHGRGGEDGTLQGFLETIGLPYTGSDVCASAVAIDKGRSKLFYERAGLPTPAWTVIDRNEPYSIDAIIDEVGEHCVVKAIHEGSTLGIYIVEESVELERAIEAAFEYDDEVLIEQYVAGPEYTVVVLGNREVEVLPIIEIIPANDFYDFESKYAPGGSEHICPARLDEKTTAAMQRAAAMAHIVLGCSGATRSDFILDDDGCAWVLETNTLPGMTETSLLPDAARAAGIAFPDLCTRLIDYALEAKKSV